MGDRIFCGFVPIRSGLIRWDVMAIPSCGRRTSTDWRARETWNRWDDAAYTGVKTEMLLRLYARMALTADPLPVRTGIY